MENRNTENQDDQVLEILRTLKKIQYGSVEITIHASKIVQIETREKRRFGKQSSLK
jgi:hypothetical protein